MNNTFKIIDNCIKEIKKQILYKKLKDLHWEQRRSIKKNIGFGAKSFGHVNWYSGANISFYDTKLGRRALEINDSLNPYVFRFYNTIGSGCLPENLGEFLFGVIITPTYNCRDFEFSYCTNPDFNIPFKNAILAMDELSVLTKERLKFYETLEEDAEKQIDEYFEKQDIV